MTVKVQDISREEVLMHKIALASRIMRMGFEAAITHVYGEDRLYMKEIEFQDPRKVINDLNEQLLNL